MKSRNSPIQNIATLFQILAVIIAAFWSWFAFNYQYVILPSREPIVASITSDLQYVKSDDSLDYYSLNYSIKNSSNKTDYFPATFFNIYAFKIRKTNSLSINIQGNDWDDNKYNKYISLEGREIVASAKMFFDNAAIQAQSEVSASKIIAVPKNKFDILRVITEVFQTKRGYALYPLWHANSDNYTYADLKDSLGNVLWKYNDGGSITDFFHTKGGHMYMTGNNRHATPTPPTN